MKKTDPRITKRESIEEKPMRSPIIIDEEWEVLDESRYCHNDDAHGCEHHGHNHHPKPDPCPPVPPKPVPPKPQPTDIKYGDGLQVNNNVVSVKVDKYCDDYMYVTKDGLCILPLLKKIEKMHQAIVRLEKRLTDAESDINKLKGQAKPESITKVVVGESESFIIDKESGKIAIKTNDGIRVGEEGYLQINGNDTIAIDDNGKMGVDYDEDTLGLIGDDEDKKLSTVIVDWESGDWNS